MKIGFKIESVIGMNFKKLLTKIMNLIFKYILSNYFIECGWRCYKLIHPTCLDFLIKVLLIIHQQVYKKKKKKWKTNGGGGAEARKTLRAGSRS